MSDSGTDAVWVPGGNFRTGSDKHDPEEAPAHFARVDGRWPGDYPNVKL